MDWKLCKEDTIILEVKPLTIKYLCDFYANARPLDLLEVEYARGVAFGDSNIDELRRNTMALVDDKDNVYAIGGYYSHVVWMLCTNKVEQNKIKFLRFIKDYYSKVIEKEEWLYNYVWLGNELHVKWLKWLGATFKEEIYKGTNDSEFMLFTFSKEGSVMQCVRL